MIFRALGKGLEDHIDVRSCASRPHMLGEGAGPSYTGGFVRRHRDGLHGLPFARDLSLKAHASGANARA